MAVSKELFLSYGRETEVISFVRRLKHDLETRGLSVWLDAEDIPAGCDWHGAIGTGLDQCKAIIAVITNKYINSKFCTSELYTANSDQKLIYPVIYEDVDFSSSEKARGVKYVIGSINWTMFRPQYEDYHASLEKLFRGMREHGLGGGLPSVVDGPISDQMAQVHLSPPFPPPPPRASSPHGPVSPSHPHQFTPSPTAPLPTSQLPQVYTSQPGHTQHHAYYPYALPQGYNYPPYAGYPYPYNSPSPHHPPPLPPPPHSTPPHAFPPHPSPHAYYTPPIATAINPVTVTTVAGGAPPPYSAHYSQERGEGVAKQPLHSPQHDPPPTSHSYLETTPTRPHPQHMPTPSHLETTPTAKKAPPTFEVGMKLEAVDRRFPYFVCVATIMDHSESEVLIHFDGWGPEYDYWCPSGSAELHPATWCREHHWELQKPLNQEWNSWGDYLRRAESTAAPHDLFTADQLAEPGSLLFQQGMRLEAKDRQNPSVIAVATVAKLRDGKLLVHFDGWSNRYDYWCLPNSVDMHPPHWCGKNGRSLQPPKNYEGSFKWSEYLRQPGLIPAPAHIFTKQQRAQFPSQSPPCSPSSSSSSSSSPPPFPSSSPLSSSQSNRAMRLQGFKTGMKLEAKDRQYPTLTCVATITRFNKNGQILIHFDGWANSYDYWCDIDSTDIHPTGWCQRMRRQLQKPKGHKGEFSWSSYLSAQKAMSAPEHLFSSAQSN